MLERHVRQLAGQQGFALCGVVDARPSDHGDHVRRWLAEGRHGEMVYLANNLDVRLDPGGLLPGARSVICVADFHPHRETSAGDDEPRGRIARYAWGDDYHKIIKKRLFTMADALRARAPDHDFRCTVDTAPLLEREHAHRTGMGWVGKHTLLIHPRLGSWMLLGGIVTTLPIELDDTPRPMPDHCGTCTRCIDACPTDCITPYEVDASRCISYLTIEHRGPIDAALHEAMGDWIAGCDICQQVCPYNGEPTDHHAAYVTRPPGPAVSLLDVLGWDANARQDALIRSALKRIKLDMWKRNALIAAGNHLRRRDHAKLKRRIEQIADDEDEADMVRQTARTVLANLSPSQGSA